MQNSNTISCITDFLFMGGRISKVELAIVFGNDWIATMDEVSQLYKNGLINKILITGHSRNKDVEPEAIRFQKRALEQGIPESAIIMEYDATNTKENIINSKKIIEDTIGFDSIQNILLVCKNFHTRRVWMTVKNYFPKNITYSFLPTVDERDIRPNNWWKNETAKERVLGELSRISEYTIKGDLTLDE